VLKVRPGITMVPVHVPVKQLLIASRPFASLSVSQKVLPVADVYAGQTCSVRPFSNNCWPGWQQNGQAAGVHKNVDSGAVPGG